MISARVQGRNQRVQQRRLFQCGHLYARDQPLANQQLAFAEPWQGHPGRQSKWRAVEFADHLAARKRLAQGHQLIDAIADDPRDLARGAAGKQSKVHGCKAS
ncbi:hypothetical protein G6F59_018076 [Rhizopus arrhizus]|nr:hypothetical protein G6F59_018076 [Rhizopus arrhizus]